MSDDLTTDGTPGAPVSLRKFIEPGHASTPLCVIVDGTPERVGVAADDPETFNVMVIDREVQAEYFLGLNLPLPEYLRKYLAVVFPKADVDALYRHARTNSAARQVIGMIQLVGGAMNVARKQGKDIRLYIEHPETHLHPEQQMHVMDMLMQLKNDYGPPEKQEASAEP